jgi:hypothetical protein
MLCLASLNILDLDLKTRPKCLIGSERTKGTVGRMKKYRNNKIILLKDVNVTKNMQVIVYYESVFFSLVLLILRVSLNPACTRVLTSKTHTIICINKDFRFIALYISLSEKLEHILFIVYLSYACSIIRVNTSIPLLIKKNKYY